MLWLASNPVPLRAVGPLGRARTLRPVSSTVPLRERLARRRGQIEERVARSLQQLDTADRREPSDALATKISRPREKIAKRGDEMRRLADVEARMLESPISRSR
jgi:hypothetical protein